MFLNLVKFTIMEYINLGKTNMKISKLCLGGMSFGNSEWMADRENSIKIIKKAIDYGINYIDTANIYSSGKSEEITGEAIDGHDDIIISTKGAGKMDEFNSGFSRKNLIKALNGSLKRLKRDHVDIYFLHTFFDDVDINDVAKTYNKFIMDGTVYYPGLSNIAGYQLAEFYTAMNMRYNIKPEIVQNHYNVVYREDERDVIPFCSKKGITYSPFSPIAAGFLSGKYKRGENNESVRTKSYPVMKKRYFKDYDYDVLNKIMDVSIDSGTKPSQVALAYIIKKGFIPVIGVNKIEYLEDDINALDVKLTNENIKTIDSAYKPHEIIQGTAGY